MPRISQSVAMGVGTAGAMTDITSYVDLDAGVEYQYGRESEFEDTVPGQFSFTLDNNDGRFTPGNPNSALATTVTEGMDVCWQLGTRLTAGTVQAIEPAFPGGESAWAQVRITCDDMLGNAARREFASIGRELVLGADPILYYPLDDTGLPAREYFGAASMDGGPGASEPSAGAWDQTGIVFGVDGPVGDTQVRFTIPAAQTDQSIGAVYSGIPISYPAGGLGTLGCWISPSQNSSGIEYEHLTNPFFGLGITAGSVQTRATMNVPGIGSPVVATGAPLTSGPSSWVEAEVTYAYSAPNYTYTVNLYANGTLLATATSGTTTQFPAAVAGQLKVYTPDGLVGDTATFSHLAWTASRVPMNKLVAPTAASLFQAFAAMVPEVTLDTLPAGLSTAPIDPSDLGGSILDAINDLVKAEQGAVYSVTSGSLTSPVEKIKIRERTRTTSAAFSFNVETEAEGATDFVRDITNLASSVTADGPNLSAIYTDGALSSRAGSKNVTDSVPFRDYSDLYTWATDRAARGANVKLRPRSLTIDAMTTPTDRSASLLAMVPGDRIQASGLPSTQLGFSTSDGWLLGASELHSTTEHAFEMFLQPVGLRPFILDTDVLAAGGNLTLTSGCTNSATSISVTSSDGTLLSTTGGDYPLKFRLENECITITAVSGASSPQTITATRGVTDPITGLATTAVAHSAAVQLEVADPAYLDF